MTIVWQGSSDPTDIQRSADGRLQREIWAVPPEEPILEALFRDIFEKHYAGIRFGPLIEGAAYEWKCPGKPTSISLMDGYLTIMFEHGGHFHLCIGDNRGTETHPTPDTLRQRRKPSLAQFFRGFGRDEKPVTWGFEMRNGADEPMISIFFPNPFIEDDDSLSETPDFSRLATWRSVTQTWLGKPPETLDEEGAGFRAG
ncbi:MAG: hypothetical protein AAGL24_02245 [Pseudomonadota bacterium]